MSVVQDFNLGSWCRMVINLVIDACRCIGIVPSQCGVVDEDGCKLYDSLCCINSKQKAERLWKQKGESDESSMCILYNQRDATYTTFFIIISALHVSGSFSAHHQEFIKLYVQPWVLSCFPAVYRWCGCVGTNPTTPAVDSTLAQQVGLPP